MTNGPIRAAAALLGIAILSCSETVGVPGESDVDVAQQTAMAAALTAVAGLNQAGFVGTSLPSVFVVRVTDAKGQSVKGVVIEWSILSGDGLFREGTAEWWATTLWKSAASVTGSNGTAQIAFMPMQLGPSTVQAAIAGSTVSPVTFSLNADGVYVEYVGPWVGSSSTYFASPCGDCLVPVGTPIRWGSVAFEWEVRATMAPEGGPFFDSGPLEWLDAFTFVPGVPGTWEYSNPLFSGPGEAPVGRFTAY